MLLNVADRNSASCCTFFRLTVYDDAFLFSCADEEDLEEAVAAPAPAASSGRTYARIGEEFSEPSPAASASDAKSDTTAPSAASPASDAGGAGGGSGTDAAVGTVADTAAAGDSAACCSGSEESGASASSSTGDSGGNGSAEKTASDAEVGRKEAAAWSARRQGVELAKMLADVKLPA